MVGTFNPCAFSYLVTESLLNARLIVSSYTVLVYEYSELFSLSQTRTSVSDTETSNYL